MLLGNAALSCLPGSLVLLPGPWHEPLFHLISCAQHPGFLRGLEQGWDSCLGMGAPSAGPSHPGDRGCSLMSPSPFPASSTLTFAFSPFAGSCSVPAPGAVCSQHRWSVQSPFLRALNSGVLALSCLALNSLLSPELLSWPGGQQREGGCSVLGSRNSGNQNCCLLLIIWGLRCSQWDLGPEFGEDLRKLLKRKPSPGTAAQGWSPHPSGCGTWAHGGVMARAVLWEQLELGISVGFSSLSDSMIVCFVPHPSCGSGICACLTSMGALSCLSYKFPVWTHPKYPNCRNATAAKGCMAGRWIPHGFVGLQVLSHGVAQEIFFPLKMPRAAPALPKAQGSPGVQVLRQSWGRCVHTCSLSWALCSSRVRGSGQDCEPGGVEW